MNAEEQKRKRNEYMARWNLKNRDKVNAQARHRRAIDPEKYRSADRKCKNKNKEKYRGLRKKNAQKAKAEMINAYGGFCVCCGENNPAFLTLEHTNHDGKEHRDKFGGGVGTYRDLRRRGWPQDGYTLLCMNCNFATRYGDPCPHHIKLTDIIYDGNIGITKRAG